MKVSLDINNANEYPSLANAGISSGTGFKRRVARTTGMFGSMSDVPCTDSLEWAIHSLRATSQIPEDEDGLNALEIGHRVQPGAHKRRAGCRGRHQGSLRQSQR